MKLAFLALLVLPVGAAAQPSFDCTKAATPVEKTICSDEGTSLATRDAALNRLYKALRPKGGHDALLERQKAWLADRDACGPEEKCLARQYDERLAALAKAAGDEQAVTGSYEYRGSDDSDFGSATLIREADGTLAGAIETVTGPTYHLCNVSFAGARPIGESWLWEASAEDTFDDNGPCRILFTPRREAVRIDSLACRTFCGVRGWFDATYNKTE